MLGIYTFGSGECDQLGLGDDIFERKNPLQIELFKDPIKVYKIAVGGMHTLVLTTFGKLYSWGNNDERALGRDGTENVPELVDKLTIPMNGISCGDSHSIAYNTEINKVFQWGVYKDNKGCIGRRKDFPEELDLSTFNIKKIKKIVSGDNHSIILASGRLYTWGNSELGQTGRVVNQEKYVEESLRLERLGLKSIIDIYAGRNHNFAIQSELKRVKAKKEKVLSLIAWGHNHYGQLGLGHLDNSVFEQREIEFFRNKKILSIGAGEAFSLIYTEGNELYGMGRNDDGQLGFENKQRDAEGKEIYTYKTPIKIESPELESLFSSSNFSYGVNFSKNQAYSWGVGLNNVLGNKCEDDIKIHNLIPKEFFKNKIIGQVGLGGSHVVLGLYDTIEIDKIVIPELEENYLDEFQEMVKATKGKSKRKTSISEMIAERNKDESVANQGYKSKLRTRSTKQKK